MTIQKDIEYLEAAVPELETYLLSKELYYPLGTRFPQLTLGAVLLAITRAGLRAESFRARVESIRLKWQSAWDAKAGREVKARSELWMNYLAEYRDDPKFGARLYSQNVRYRAMLNLLGKPAHESDALLKSIFIEGNFIWDEECAGNFSHEIFWYLFGTLKKE
jgi:hypothetical protein